MARKPPPTFFIKTFGCQMNKFDSGEFERFFLSLGLGPAASAETANVVHVNTCCVRQKAEDKFFSLLGELRLLKKQKPDMIIGVSGCIPELRDIPARHAYVNYVAGSRAPQEYFTRIREVLSSNPALVDAAPIAAPAGPVSEYVTVIRGCSNFCTYCVVPHVRGPEDSRPIRDIVADARRFLDAGAREIILLGQNALAYGADLTPPLDLLDALSAVHDLPGLRRLRFVTSHPKWLSEEFLVGMKRLPRVCEHFHIPCQAGDDDILKRMNRGYTSDEYTRKIDLIRRHFPTAGITADVIVGFPGETDEQFEHTAALLRRVVVHQAYMFMYSPRPDTAADRQEDDVPFSVKSERLQKLLAQQREISLRLNRAMLNSPMEVMVDQADRAAHRYKGRTRCNRVADFTSTRSLLPGDVVQVMVESVTPYALRGETILSV